MAKPLKMMKSGTEVAPVTGPLLRLIMVPPVNPVKSPVSVALPVLSKVGMKLILLPETVTFPAMLARPVTGVAFAEFEKKEVDIATRLAKCIRFSLIGW